MNNKKVEEINIAKLTKEINEQMWRFEQRYHTRPRFLKVGLYVYYAMRDSFCGITTTYIRINDETLNTFMGLIICDTPSVNDYSVEVF